MKQDFVKSSFSGAGQNCVETLKGDAVVVVRDSKDTAGPVLVFTHAEWDAFIEGVKAGEFDL